MGEIKRKASKISRAILKPKMTNDQLLAFLSAGITASKERDYRMKECGDKNIKDEKDIY